MKFERIGFEQFKKDYLSKISDKVETAKIAMMYTKIKTPKRSTKNSAGYDFMIPFDLEMEPNQMIYIPTGICVELDSDKYLELVPRSSSAKKGLYLGNTVGVIDSDYYHNEDNEGHILICMHTSDTPVSFKAGDKIAQGIIKQYFTVDDDDATGTRNGGFGSTDLASEIVNKMHNALDNYEQSKTENSTDFKIDINETRKNSNK